MEEYFEDNTKETLDKIRNNNTGSPIKILSIIYLVLSVLILLFGLTLGITSTDTESIIAFIFLGIILASMLFVISVGLKMFYEIHFVITHLSDSIKSNKE